MVVIVQNVLTPLPLGPKACANYGMNPVIGPVSYGNADKRDGFTKPFSEKTGEMLDDQVRKMITYVTRFSPSALFLSC